MRLSTNYLHVELNSSKSLPVGAGVNHLFPAFALIRHGRVLCGGQSGRHRLENSEKRCDYGCGRAHSAVGTVAGAICDAPALGNEPSTQHLNGVATWIESETGTTPLGLRSFPAATQGSSSQPWAGGHNPVGIAEGGGELTSWGRHPCLTVHGHPCPVFRSLGLIAAHAGNGRQDAARTVRQGCLTHAEHRWLRAFPAVALLSRQAWRVGGCGCGGRGGFSRTGVVARGSTRVRSGSRGWRGW